MPPRCWAWGVNPGPQAHSRWLRMDAQAQRLVLTQGPADDCACLGWQSPNAQSVQLFAEHLERLGVRHAWGSDDELALRGVDRLVHFQDPMGNRHEVYCSPFVAPERFISAQVASGFVTGAGGMGHAVFEAPDPDATVDFAQRVLGLRLSDQLRMQLTAEFTLKVTFMHINPRHHSLVVAPAQPGARRRLHHLMLEVGDVNDVGLARDRSVTAGHAVQMDIGQHPNDGMISFYGRTPSGFLVEVGHGGVQVDDARWQVTTFSRISNWGHRPNTEVASPGSRGGAAAANAKTASSGAAAAVAVAVAAGGADTASAAGVARCAPAPGISGAWNVIIRTPVGDNPVTFNLQADGARLYGDMASARETNEITDGRIAGNHLSWRAKVSHPMPMELELHAVVEGNAISGSAKGPLGSVPFAGSKAG